MTVVERAAPVFELKAVRYCYQGHREALAGIDLRVMPGERLALLGANGSGKSTLLRLLDGLHAPSGGEMWVLGQPLNRVLADAESLHRFHRQVGLVFQDPDIQLFSPTVGDDVAFGPLQLGLADEDVERRVAAALEKMGIGHLRDRAPFELSGGEKKRAAIASVLSLEPDVLLLDEPTAALDPRTKSVLVDLVVRLADEGRTLITATHELDIVPVIAERVVVLGEDRRVLADGPTDRILVDEALLLRANLIHEHLHAHPGATVHAHAHEADHHDEAR